MKLFYCLFLLLTVGVARADAQAAPSPPSWSPAARFLPYLDRQVVLDGCAFNPPQGFRLISTESFASGRKLYRFTGPTHPGGFAPSLSITTETSRTHGPDWQVFTGMEALIDEFTSRIIGGGTVSPTGRGLVNGQPALRFYVKGDYDLNPRSTGILPGGKSLHRVIATHLFAYGVGDDKLGTIFLARDVEPYSKDTMDWMEASAQTLRLAAPPPDVVPADMPAAIYPGQWMPRPELMRFLKPEVINGSIGLRVPQGFEALGISTNDPALHMLAWDRSSRGSSSVDIYRFTIETLPAGQPQPRLEDLMGALMAEIGKDLQDYSTGKMETGTSAFGPTMRCNGAGTLRFVGGRMPKTVAAYGFLTKTQFVRMEAITTDPDPKPSLDVMITAFLASRFLPPPGR